MERQVAGGCCLTYSSPGKGDGLFCSHACGRISICIAAVRNMQMRPIL